MLACPVRPLFIVEPRLAAMAAISVPPRPREWPESRDAVEKAA